MKKIVLPENIDPRPKRRRHKDNQNHLYSIGKGTADPHFYVAFIDVHGIQRDVEISEDLFNLFDEFELEDLSFLNECNNHHERNDLIEPTITRRATIHNETMEERVERLSEYSELHKAIKTLPRLQKRRLLLLYFNDLTFKKIGKMEGCNYQAIQNSLDKALSNLRKFFKDFY